MFTTRGAISVDFISLISILNTSYFNSFLKETSSFVGADPNRKDVEGLSAEAIAKIYDFKGFADDLFVRRWYLRAEAMIPEHLNPPMMAFQMYDSKYPTWFYGDYGQLYLQVWV
ncbi:unnamed protein product [Dibothriocephalus latus]|uniref:Uncharacterized protein n=1 Tax=Dibothriocephalus latus TaxID=60516 RepID=A0A3P6PX07_DIBLA|nr:unnamed protein product [Dibothriocephalus latus]